MKSPSSFDLHGLRPAPRLPAEAHKGDAGRVLCIAGSETMPGAAILAARAAQRGGAGLVTVGCLDASLLSVVPGAVPEAILLDLTGTFGPAGERSAAADLLAGARDPDALLIGPGMGDTARTKAVVLVLLEASPGTPRVFDADALNVLRGEPEALLTAVGPVVITPHPGEAARLAGSPVPADGAGRASFARDLARRTGAVCCLKGRATVVSDGERTFVNPTGNPGMATAGTGDVLAGLLVAYLALAGRGEPPWDVFEAAALAVLVHGHAGDHAAARRGRRALVASDLIDALGTVQRAWE